MIRARIVTDLQTAIAAVKDIQQWPDFEMPIIDCALAEMADTCAYQSNIALRLAPLVKRHALEVAADIKSHLPKTYADVDIVHHGILQFHLSTAQMEHAVQSIVENGASYGASTIGAYKKVLVECFSIVPSHPLNITDARAAYTADVIARIYSELGYAVTRAVLLYDRADEIERLGESVARRYLQRMGINVPYDDHLIHAEYVNELSTHIELKEMTLNNIQKIEWLKKHIAQSATELLRVRMNEMLEKQMRITITEWKKADELLAEVASDAMLAHLKEKKQLYERGGSTYIRTAQFGDVRDRAILDRAGNQIDQYAELVLQYDRTVKKRYDHIVLSLPWKQQDRAWFARQLPKLFDVKSTVATILSGPIQMVADGEPVRMRHTTVDDIFIADVIDTYGADIIRWYMLTHTSADELPFDVQTTSKQVSDELKLIRHQKKAILTHLRAADSVGTVDESFDAVFDAPIEKRLLHLLLLFPEVLEKITKNHELHQLYAYFQELRDTTDQFKKECPVVVDDAVIVHRYLLLQATRFVIGRILSVSGMRDKKRV